MNIYRELVNENPLAYLERLVVALIISTNNIGSEQTNEKIYLLWMRLLV